MARTILVTVGISLATEKVGDKEKAVAGFGQLGKPFPSLTDLRDGLAAADRQQQEGQPFNANLRKWVEARTAMVGKIQDLWQNDPRNLSDAKKREWSGAELASLHLLGKEENSAYTPLSTEDRVVLLASDTPSGKFCAETIASVLRQGFVGVVPADVCVADIAGLRATDSQLFLAQGLPNTARLLAQYRADSILVASGGYKGLLPYLTPIAMQLQIPLLYLYEESDRLLEIAPLKIPDDLLLVKEFRRAFNEIDPNSGGTVAHAADFWAMVENKDPNNGRVRIQATKLVKEVGNTAKLTDTGVLACLLESLVLRDE